MRAGDGQGCLAWRTMRRENAGQRGREEGEKDGCAEWGTQKYGRGSFQSDGKSRGRFARESLIKEQGNQIYSLN